MRLVGRAARLVPSGLVPWSADILVDVLR
jgi:pimeloyl-ACP methyl ester carboxylesterase